MNPRVSVIIPSYNHALYLRECIESVIWQSFQDWELLIIDDLSSDDSLAVAKRFTDPRIRVAQNAENMGTYATQNVGIDMAKGEFIAILNSDDVWLPRKLQLQIEVLEGCPECTFSYTAGQLVDEDGDRVAGDADNHADYPRDPVQNLLPFLLFENRVLASSVMFRKSATRFNGALRYSGDWAALLSLASKGPAAYVAESVTVWRQHPENSYTRLLKVLPEEIAMREAILAKADEWRLSNNPEEVNRRLAQCAIALAAIYIRAGKKHRAREVAKLASKFDPKSRRARALYVLSVVPGSVARQRLWKQSKMLQIELAGAVDLMVEG
jgi:glycosyltransferase involved in cell wall biosynthesis